ncbi:MAG: hypothetical protein J6Z49_10590 [Kiritimatiellae bacterium]|nr:hypothetical protein [Kiritimatiellia bacterium]
MKSWREIRKAAASSKRWKDAASQQAMDHERGDLLTSDTGLQTSPDANSEFASLKSFSYIFGHLPFPEWRQKNAEQQTAVEWFFRHRDIDYMARRNAKAAGYGSGRCAFVSTHSITQSGQAAALWRTPSNYGVACTEFARHTSKWRNEAKGVAAAYCANISFYAENGASATGRSDDSTLGSMPIDGGNLVIETDEVSHFANCDTRLPPLVKRRIGAKEYIPGGDRWCLWLRDEPPETLRKMPLIQGRRPAFQTLHRKGIRR